METKKMKLCYVDGNFAYFTSDLEKQWGDDWNDKPYEHNSGEPYEHDGKKIEIVAFRCESLKTPADRYYPNSPFSVEEINQGKIPWLHGGWKEEVFIYAGDSIEDFKDLVIQAGGEVYFKK